MNFRHLTAIVIGICLALAAQTALAGKMTVFVSIVPQRDFVQQIGGDLVDVHVMVEPGASPATYEPKPRQMAALSAARLYFAVGVPFENVWLEKIAAANPGMTVVRTDRGITKRRMAAHRHAAEAGERHEAEHGHAAEHGHEGLDPHIWLSPPLVKIQAGAIAGALQAADPANRSSYEAGYRGFAERIDRLDAELRQVFAGRQGMRFMVFHPAWGYFADAYGLRQVPIEIEGKNPKPAQLRELIAEARESDIRVIFVQPQFSTKSAALVAREIGGAVVRADPLAPDWIANLRAAAGKFNAALK